MHEDNHQAITQKYEHLDLVSPVWGIICRYLTNKITCCEVKILVSEILAFY